MLGAHRRAIQGEQSAALEDAIEDGLCEVVVVEHVAPGGQRLVGREDHRPLLPVPIVDDVEEHVGGVGPVREVAHFVDDEDARLDVRSERLGELPSTKRGREIVDEFRGRHEARVEAILNRAVGDRDREMGLAAARFPTQDHAPAFGHKLGRERGPEQREADGRLVQEVEIIDRLQKRKAGAAHEPRDARLLPLRDLLGDDERQEVAIGPLLPLGALRQITPGPSCVGEVEAFEQGVEGLVGERHRGPPSVSKGSPGLGRGGGVVTRSAK